MFPTLIKSCVDIRILLELSIVWCKWNDMGARHNLFVQFLNLQCGLIDGCERDLNERVVMHEV